MKTEDAITRLRQEGFVAHYEKGSVQIYEKYMTSAENKFLEITESFMSERFVAIIPVSNGEVDGERISKILSSKRETSTEASKGPSD